MPPPTLKRRHSLVGRNILPVVKKIRTHQNVRLNYARLKAATPLEDLNDRELQTNFKTLTDENAVEILEMAGKEPNSANLRALLHYTIIHANEAGTPAGQRMTQDSKEDEVSDDSNSNEEVDELEKPKRKKSKKEDDGLQGLKQKVRILASQNKPSEALLLLTLEELATKARQMNHDDAELYEELARQASRNQGKVNIVTLALNVLGGKASDVISKALSKCMKEKTEQDQKVDNIPDKPKEWQSPLANLYQQPYAQGAMPFFYSPYMQPYPYGGVRPQNRFNYGRRAPSTISSPRQLGPCLFCDGMGHLIKDCLKLKAMKQQK